MSYFSYENLILTHPPKEAMKMSSPPQEPLGVLRPNSGKITSCAERFVSNNFYMICTHQAHSKKMGGPRPYEFLLKIVFWRQMVGYRMFLMCVRTKNMRQV